MTNVLPLDTQKKLWRVQRARFVVLFAIVAIVLATIAGLSMLPSYVALEMNTQTPEQTAEATSASEDVRNMTRAQAQVLAVTPIIAATSSPVSAIEHALSLRPKGVTVDRVRYVSSTSGVQKQIMLTGAASREGLTAYRGALESDGMFTSVAVPVGALFTESGRFSLTLSGDF